MRAGGDKNKGEQMGSMGLHGARDWAGFGPSEALILHTIAGNSVPAHPRNIIGPQLRRLRMERGLSQTAFAALCQRIGWDIGRDTIKHMEEGARWVADMELVLLAQCLGVTVDTLLPSPRQAVKLALSRIGS